MILKNFVEVLVHLGRFVRAGAAKFDTLFLHSSFHDVEVDQPRRKLDLPPLLPAGLACRLAAAHHAPRSVNRAVQSFLRLLGFHALQDDRRPTHSRSHEPLLAWKGGRAALSDARSPKPNPWFKARNPDAVRWPNPRDPKCTPIQRRPCSSSKRSTK